MASSSASAPLQFGEALTLTLGKADRFATQQDCSLHRGRDRAAYQAIEPVIVAALGTLLPFIYRATATFGLHAILGREMLGEQAMLIGLVPKQRETTTITHRDRESRMHKRLPEVRVEYHVPHGSLAMHVGHSPVMPDAVAGTPLVLGERLA
jgi:hypothetical protein